MKTLLEKKKNNEPLPDMWEDMVRVYLKFTDDSRKKAKEFLQDAEKRYWEVRLIARTLGIEESK